MTGATAGGALAHRPAVPGAPDGVARGCDAVLDAAIVVLATWTLIYHVCFLLRLDSTIALVLEAAVLGAVLSGIARARVSRRQAAPDGPDGPVSSADGAHGADGADGGPTVALRALAGQHPRLLWTTVGLAGLAAVSMALRLPWVLVWVPWLVAAGSGTALALRTLPRGRWPGRVHPGAPTRPESLVVVGLAVAVAVLSLVVLRPNPDDLFYVNLSQWVAAHGTFPHRDTIYADLTYPLSNWPPLASYDAGVGALAHLLGLEGATVAYVGVPPVVAVLSVLALWRLLRTWRVRHVLVALAAAVVFMMFDGTSSYGPPGNLWVTRLWQGKVILLCVVVPMLLVMALRYVETPSRRRAAWLGVGGVAAIACSTTAVFLVPVVAAAAAAPLIRSAPRRAATVFGAMSAYPLAMGVVTKAVGGRSADDFGSRRQYRFDPSWFGHEVFLDGVIALVGVAAVLLGCLLVPHPAARVTTAAAAALTGITFIPGVTHLGYDTVGLGPTLWRLTWSLSVAALIGVAASYLATVLRPRVGVAVAVASTALVAVFGHCILAPDTTTTFAMPGHWQRGPGTTEVTDWILDHTRPGDVVLGPDGVSITVAVTTTAVKTVTPRDYYMDYLRDDPRFDYDQRLALNHFVNLEGSRQPSQIAPALRALDVRIACVYRTDDEGTRLLRAAGYRPGLRTDTYRCLTAPG